MAPSDGNSGSDDKPDEDDVPTNRTGSWAVSIGRSRALIIRLDRARHAYKDRAVSYRSSNVLMRDLKKADEYDKHALTCDDNVFVLESMIKRFEKWPKMPQVEVDKERTQLLEYLKDITSETDALCARLGKTY